MRASSYGRAWSLTAAAMAGLLVLACSGGDRAGSATKRASSADVAQDVAIDRYLADIEKFWARTLPVVFEVDLDPVVRVVPYRPSEPATLPPCNGVVGDPLLYAENALYCRVENSIVYDAEGFVGRLRADHGTFALGVLLAHEYAHAIQSQTGERGSALGIELQADCFAGAWAAGFRADDELSIGPADLDAALGSYLEFADPADTAIGDADAHGTAFERMSAFSDGFHVGATVCASYDTDPPMLTRTSSGGFEEWNGSVPAFVEGLEKFWSSVSAAPGPEVLARGGDATIACNRRRTAAEVADRVAVCIADGAVFYDELGLLRLDGGRPTAGYALAVAYSHARLADAGAAAATPALTIAADCAVGSFVAAAPSNNAGGGWPTARDLDGIVGAMVAFDPTGLWRDGGADVSFLARVEALRTGFRQGLTGCGITPER